MSNRGIKHDWNFGSLLFLQKTEYIGNYTKTWLTNWNGNKPSLSVCRERNDRKLFIWWTRPRDLYYLCISQKVTHQYCHIFRACNGRLQRANANTTMINIRITPRRARNTLLDECETWYSCVPPWCLWWKLCERHVVVITLSESTETYQLYKQKMDSFIFVEVSNWLNLNVQIY